MQHAAKNMTDKEALIYQINHVFLPPDLPQEDDKNESHEKALLETVCLGLKLFREYFPTNQRYKLDHCIRMVDNMICIRDRNGFLDPIILDDKIENLSDYGWCLTVTLRKMLTIPLRRPCNPH